MINTWKEFIFINCREGLIDLVRVFMIVIIFITIYYQNFCRNIGIGR